MHAFPISATVALAAFVAVCIFAIWKGGPEERLAGIALAIGTAATPLLKDHRWLGPQWGVLAVDLAYLALLIWISLRTRRWWPLFAAGFQLLGVLTHLASWMDRTLGAWAYITGGVIWTYLGLFSVAVGAANAWRERHQLARAGAPSTDPGATLR